MSLSEPAASLTDLALGLVALWLALGMRGAEGPGRYWRRAFEWTAAAALAGSVHHGVITYSERWRDLSWAVISGMVVIAISYILAATVGEVLGPGRGRAFWVLRSGSLLAYAVVALLGHGGIEAILSCEGVTMVAVLALWARAARARHPLAPGVIGALLASMAAASLRAMPADLLPVPGMDPTSLYHVAQIPGLILLFAAVSGGIPGWTRRLPRPLLI